jgi:hypothetical protein
MKMLISRIRLDGDTQSRELINDGVVERYTENIMSGTIYPAVDVFDDGADIWLADGFHRIFAHKRAKQTEIAVKIHPGTLREARAFALGANDEHGFPRTNADRRKSVRKALDDLEYQDWSDRVIGKLCKVSHVFVAKCKKDAGILAKSAVTYTTKHGTQATMQTKNIGKVNPPTVATPKPVEPIDEVIVSAPLERYTPTDDDQITELSHVNADLHEENLKLHDKMTVLSDDQSEINAKFEDLRNQITSLNAELKAVKSSRDQFQAKNADLIKQINFWRKRAEKAEKSTT